MGVRQPAAATPDGWGTVVTDTTAHHSPALDGFTSTNGSPGLRVASGTAAVSTGLLAGSLFYGWANMVPTFAAVPLYKAVFSAADAFCVRCLKAFHSSV